MISENNLQSVSTVETIKDDDWLDECIDKSKLSKPLLILNRAKPLSYLPVSLTDCNQIASYNWITDPRPCIVVPGAPRKYIGWPGGSQYLMPDFQFRSRRLIDENHHIIPRYPMDPLFRSVDYSFKLDGQQCNFQKYDIVTDRNNLRKLFNYCCIDNNNNNSDDHDSPIVPEYHSFKNFRIDIQRIGNVVVLIRREKTDIEKYVLTCQILRWVCNNNNNLLLGRVRGIIVTGTKQIATYNLKKHKIAN